MPAVAGGEDVGTLENPAPAAVDPKSSYWYMLWKHVGFDDATALKAAQSGIASPNDLSQMFHIIRTSSEYQTIFPGIDQLAQSQNWDFSPGATQSAEAAYYQWKSNVQNYAKQYGFSLSTADYANYAYRGWGQGDVNNFFQGRQWVNTNQKDLGYYFGNFMGKQLSSQDYEQLAEAQGGLANKQGSQLEDLFMQAQKRAQAAFQGVTGSLGSAVDYINPQQNPDTGS